MSNEARPYAIIVAGPNGAGKSTLAPKLVAQEFGITIYVNPDVIAQGLAGFDPASAGIRAGRILHERLEELRAERDSFAVESTISGRSLQGVLRTLKASGYTTLLVYLWLPEPDLAVERVANRVRLGGHHVPEADIRRRFHRSVVNFQTVYRRTRWTTLSRASSPMASAMKSWVSWTRTRGSRFSGRYACTRETSDEVVTERRSSGVERQCRV